MLNPLFSIAVGAMVAFSSLADNKIVQCGVGVDKQSTTVVFSKPSLFGDVYVVESDSKRYLRFGNACGADQSSIDLDHPDDVIVEYVRHASLSLIYAKSHKNILVVGMGGGVFSNLMLKHLPDVFVDSIEIDPVVVEAANKYFNVSESAHHKIYIQDAEKFTHETRQHYDIIFLDAYGSDGIPEHLKTKMFFRQIAGLLNEGGVVVANFGLDVPQVYLHLAERLKQTLGETRCIHGIEEPNLVVIAGKSNLINAVNPIEKIKKLSESVSMPYALTDVAKRVKTCPQI